MIFQIFKIRNTIKDVKNNPSKFAGDELGNLFMSIFIMPIISGVTLLIGLFILGYTHFLGGPYGFFRFLFVVSIIGVFCFFYMLKKVYNLIKQTTKNTLDQTIKVESKVVE